MDMVYIATCPWVDFGPQPNDSLWRARLSTMAPESQCG